LEFLVSILTDGFVNDDRADGGAALGVADLVVREGRDRTVLLLQGATVVPYEHAGV